MKRITLSEWIISFITIFSLSSNCPLYFVPAISAPRSRDTMRFPMRFSGTSPRIIFCERPSTIAVLPTPGSPIITGLFFILLPSIWSTRSISSSLPITGSSLPSFAIWVRSLPNSSRAGVELLSFIVCGWALIEKFIASCLAARRFAPKLRSVLPAMPSSSLRIPSRRCSLPM